MNRKSPRKDGLVYSTDPNFNPEDPGKENQATLPPDKQKIRLHLDTRQRAGKTITALVGFVGTATDRENLAKKLKTYCGTGGSVKDGMVLIQGDQRDKILAWLLNNGFKQSKKI